MVRRTRSKTHIKVSDEICFLWTNNNKQIYIEIIYSFVRDPIIGNFSVTICSFCRWVNMHQSEDHGLPRGRRPFLVAHCSLPHPLWEFLTPAKSRAFPFPSFVHIRRHSYSSLFSTKMRYILDNLKRRPMPRMSKNSTVMMLNQIEIQSPTWYRTHLKLR